MTPATSDFLDRLRAALPGGGDALGDLELALVVLAALVALSKEGHEPPASPAAAARGAMDFMRKVGTVLPDKGRAVRQVLPHGGQRAPVEAAIADAIERHRNRGSSFIQ